jgi:hypothetical protein
VEVAQLEATPRFHPRAGPANPAFWDGVIVPKKRKQVAEMSASILIINLAVLLAVLSSDLGTRKVGALRIARPLLLAFGTIPLFIDHPATAGSGEALELALTGLGALLGIVASTRLMRVNYDAAKGYAVSRAGAAYGIFWVAVIGARLLFTYGANHWFSSALLHWMSTNRISADALTDGLIFMAIAMTLTRTIRLMVAHGHTFSSNRGELAVQS